MADQFIILDKNTPHIAKISFNNPGKKNAMTEEMGREFRSQINELKNDSDVRLVILSGADDAFSAGGSIDMLFAKTKKSSATNESEMLEFYQNFLSITELEVPTIAAINGAAVGAGLCVALACDIRIAVNTAKLGLNFVKLGLHPGMAATHFLPKIVGQSRAAELLYSGRLFTADYAAQIGLVNIVCEKDSFADVVDDFANSIAENGPKAIKHLKQTLREFEGSSLAETLAREAKVQAINYADAEFAEGIRAAKEKEKPKF